MPVNVRPSFVKISVDGRSTDIATGPRARDGEMSMEILVRQFGGVLHLFDVECIGSADKKTTLVRITDKRNGKVIFEERFEQ